jgi:hypothetical protein
MGRMVVHMLHLWFFITIILLSSCERDINTHSWERSKLSSIMQNVASDLDKMGFRIDTTKINLEVLPKAEMAMLFNSMNNLARQEIKSKDINTTQEQWVTSENSGQRNDARLAFYDPNSKTIFFLAGATKNLQNGYLAHELAHAYQDQQFDFAAIWKPYHESPSKELFNITQYVVEGYAELVRQTYEQIKADNPRTANVLSMKLGKFAEEECAECFSVKSATNLPYSLGLRFMVHQLKQGGWPLVDKFLLNLPGSTEQIIHPNKLLIDEPTDIKLPKFKDPSIKTEVKLSGKLGEGFLLGKLLSMSVPVKEAFKSASGFDGDDAQLITTEDGREALMWRIIFDRDLDAQQLEASLNNVNGAYFLVRNGRVIDWIISNNYELNHKLHAFLNKNRLILPQDQDDQNSTNEQEINMKNEHGPLINPYYY